MGLRVRLNRQALLDLQAIKAYHAPLNPKAAERVRQHIWRVIDRLADMPASGLQTDNPRVRVAVLSRYPYRVFYTFDAVALTVLHVRHVARATPDVDRL